MAESRENTLLALTDEMKSQKFKQKEVITVY